MADNRLSNLSIMSIEKDIMDKVNVNDVIDRFALKKNIIIIKLYTNPK